MSFIAPDDHWVIWTCLIGISLLSLYLEANFKACQKVTGALLAMLGGMILSNIGFLPTESVSYDIVSDYFIPLIIPLLLMKTDIRRIFSETGRLFGAFHLSALGTVIGSLVAVLVLYKFIPSLASIVPAMTGSYIGGGVNFIALKETFSPPEYLSNATLLADNAIMALYFLFLLAFSSLNLTRKFFPKTDKTEQIYKSVSDGSKGFHSACEISLMDITLSLFLAFSIAMSAVKISTYFSAPAWNIVIRSTLGQKYIMLTSLTVCFPLLFPRLAEKIKGAEILGVFFVFIFFTLIGIPASIKAVIVNAPLMLLFCAIILAFNFIVTIILGKLFKYEVEELIVAAVVTSGGPMNGAAIASSKGWNSLVVPSLLVGVWGYIVGNYLGYLTGLILKNLPLN